MLPSQLFGCEVKGQEWGRTATEDPPPQDGQAPLAGGSTVTDCHGQAQLGTGFNRRCDWPILLLLSESAPFLTQIFKILFFFILTLFFSVLIH